MSNESKALPAKQPWTSQRVLDLLLNNALIIIMAFAVVYIAFKNPNFIKPASLINILSQTCAYLPVALGVGGCIVLTGTDLSAGRIVGLTACISASLLQAITTTSKMWENITPPNVLLVLALAMVIGALFGAFNGFFVAKFKLHPFIVTLATQLIVYTILLLYVKAGNNKGMAISGLDKSYSDFITGSLPFAKVAGTPIPNYVWIALVCTAVMWFIWNKTTFGKNMFALGANEEAARVSGVNVFTTTILVFALAGAMYAVTGFIEGARVASNTANTGLNYEADAIAACVIGGVSFVGGIGKISGIVIGVLMLRLIFIGLTMAKHMARICLVPNSVLVPIIVALACIGTYALSNNMMEVVIMLVFGLIGYLMKIFEFEPAPLVLGVVLADILESNFRRTLIMAAPKGGLIPYFLTRPVSIIIVLVILAFALAPVVIKAVQKKRA